MHSIKTIAILASGALLFAGVGCAAADGSESEMNDTATANGETTDVGENAAADTAVGTSPETTDGDIGTSQENLIWGGGLGWGAPGVGGWGSGLGYGAGLGWGAPGIGLGWGGGFASPWNMNGGFNRIGPF